MAKKGQTFTKYSPNFKLSVIPDMRKNILVMVKLSVNIGIWIHTRNRITIANK